MAAEQASAKDLAPTPKNPTERVAAKSTAMAPRGVPTLSDWTVNPQDKSIRNVITGDGGVFSEGQPVTTSLSWAACPPPTRLSRPSWD